MLRGEREGVTQSCSEHQVAGRLGDLVFLYLPKAAIADLSNLGK